jgi:CRP/FNR family transcriptional regulator
MDAKDQSFDTMCAALSPLPLAPATRSAIERLGNVVVVPRGLPAPIPRGADSYAYILEGATKLVARIDSERQQILAFHVPGDLILLPASGAHDYSLCALTDTRLIALPAARFVAALAAEPRILQELNRRAGVALYRCREKSIILGRKTAQERVASFLLTMAERIGRYDQGAWVIELPMSRRDIADSLGLTIETVSRQFGELRECGAIATSGRSIVRLTDLGALTGRAGFAHCLVGESTDLIRINEASLGGL